MLSSWKEIAHFFGKGVRTVQRWEKTLDLPIRRPPGAPSNVVLARTSDLEEWMHRSSTQRAMHEDTDGRPEDLKTAISELDTEVVRLLQMRPGRPQDAAAVDEEEDALSRVRHITEKLRFFREESEHASPDLKKVA